MPFPSIINPEPKEVNFRYCLGLFRSKNSRKKSSNGEPGGNWGSSGLLPALCFKTAVVDILTTAGSNFSAKLAKLSGAERAPTVVEKTIKTRNKETGITYNNFKFDLVTLNSPITGPNNAQANF